MKNMLTIAALTLATLSAAAWADDVAAPKDNIPGQVAPGAKADDKKEKPRPVAADMVSPDAANQVDQQDLLKRLTGDTGAEPAPGNSIKKLDEVLERMNTSADLLTKRDPGEITQETQHRIVTDLDVLIEEAIKQEQKGGGQGKSQKPGQGQKNTGSKGKQPGQTPGGNQAAPESVLRDGATEAAVGNESLIDVRNDKWSQLPPRFRDDITHAVTAEVLPAFKTRMERFYEELAKTSSPK